MLDDTSAENNGSEFSPTALDPRLIDEMIADHNDGIRCEQAITEEEIEQMRVQAEKAEWRNRWRAMCERHEKRRLARERYQAKKAGKAVVA